MKRYEIGMLLVVALAMTGCATTQEVPTRHVYYFDDGGQTYEIVSMVHLTGEGANYLVYREDGAIRMSARDDDQDGTLDAMVAGDMRLRDANAIYEAGVDHAMETGRTALGMTTRVFTADREEGRYMVKTYLMPDGLVYNRLFAQGSNGAYEVVVMDEDADGTLDAIEGGDGDLEVLQEVYDALLEEGIETDCVHLTDGRYVVEQKRERKMHTGVSGNAPSMP